jgi:hypothetical protein
LGHSRKRALPHGQISATQVTWPHPHPRRRERLKHMAKLLGAKHFMMSEQCD